MTLSDPFWKIITTGFVAIVSYLFKRLPKFQLFNTFSRMSTADKTQLFSLLYKSRGGFLDAYAIQSQMQAFGIKYSPQFMRNLFYYTLKEKIRDDNQDLSAFLSLPGLFICKDNGEVRVVTCARLLSLFFFVVSILLLIFVVSQLYRSIDLLPLFLAQQHYFLLALQTAMVLVGIAGLIISLMMLYLILFRSIPAFRFVRRYKAAWKRRDVFEEGEQNLYCGNEVRE